MFQAMSDKITGGCLCGAIRYEATGKPYDSTHCHCEDCRRSSGAPFVTWASFRRNEFRFTAGTPREIKWATRLRYFCPDCGTPLMFATDPPSDELGITISTFDHPEKVTPADHTWVRDRLPWVQLSDGLPTFPEARAPVI